MLAFFVRAQTNLGLNIHYLKAHKFLTLIKINDTWLILFYKVRISALFKVIMLITVNVVEKNQALCYVHCPVYFTFFIELNNISVIDTDHL